MGGFSRRGLRGRYPEEEFCSARPEFQHRGVVNGATLRPAPVDAGRGAAAGNDTVALDSDAEEYEIVAWTPDQLIALAQTLAPQIGNLKDAKTLLSQIDEFSPILANGKMDKSLLQGLKKAFGSGNFYEKVANGKTYVILKGRPGLRRTLRAARFLNNNEKIVSMSIGRHALKHGAKVNFVITIVAVAGFDFIECMRDEKITLTDFGVKLAPEIAKVSIGALSSTAAVLLTAKLAVGSIAWPVTAGILVSVAVGYLLDEFDERYEFTSAMQRAIREQIDAIQDTTREVSRTYQWLNTPEGMRWLIQRLGR